MTPDRIPAASGLTNFVRITAGAFGTSISTTLWENRAALHHAQLAEHISRRRRGTTQALGALQAGGLTPGAGAGAAQPAGRPAGLHAGRQRLFYVSALLFLLLIAVVWLASGAGRRSGCSAHGRGDQPPPATAAAPIASRQVLQARERVDAGDAEAGLAGR